MGGREIGHRRCDAMRAESILFIITPTYPRRHAPMQVPCPSMTLLAMDAERETLTLPPSPPEEAVMGPSPPASLYCQRL